MQHGDVITGVLAYHEFCRQLARSVAGVTAVDDCTGVGC
jgi:hypothetical protein